MMMETLEELEWCLEQLEKIQTHKSVSDMATSKVCARITSTFSAERRNKMLVYCDKTTEARITRFSFKKLNISAFGKISVTTTFEGGPP